MFYLTLYITGDSGDLIYLTVKNPYDWGNVTADVTVSKYGKGNIIFSKSVTSSEPFGVATVRDTL